MARNFNENDEQYFTFPAPWVPNNTAPNDEVSQSVSFKDNNGGSNDREMLQFGDQSSANDFYRLERSNTNNNVQLHTRDGGSNSTLSTTSTYTTGEWHHGSCSSEPFTSADHRVYRDGAFEQSNTNSLSTPDNIDVWIVGAEIQSNNPGDSWAGDLCNIGLWNGMLDAIQHSSLGLHYDPILVGPEMLRSWSTLLEPSGSILDLMTGNASSNFGDTNPPTEATHAAVLSVDDEQQFFMPVAEGGEQTPQAVGGALSFSGVQTRLIDKLVAGSISPTGAQTRETQKQMAGGLTFAGGLVRFTDKLLTGALSFVGDLVGSKLAFESVGGVLSFTGALIKQAQKQVTGDMSFASAMTRETQKQMAGGITPSSGMSRDTSKAVTGALSFTGVAAGIKAALQSVAGVLSFGGNLAKETQKQMAGDLSFSSGMSRTTLKLVAGVLDFVGNLLTSKLTLQAVDGVVSFVGGIATLFIPGGGLTIRRMWRSLWSRVWKNPGDEDEDT